MRTKSPMMHALDHGVYSNVLPDQHHNQPTNLEIVNTTQNVYPLPGDPADWDISVPFDTQAVMFHLRSSYIVELDDAAAGVVGIATRNQFHTSTMSVGGDATITRTAYAAVYSKVASALNLSHKIFSNSGDDIALTEAHLVQTGPSTRVLRLTFTNYGASLKQLHCWGQVGLLA
jgi:hypothetical protein